MPNKEHVITICPNFDFYLMDGERESLDLADLQDKAGGCYIQWVRRDNCKTEELLLGIHHFDYYADDGSSMDTYTIYPDGICFEAAGFGPRPVENAGRGYLCSHHQGAV